MIRKNTLYTLFARDEAKLPMALLGVLVGVFAGLITNLFRFILEETFPYFGNGLHHDNFEALPSVLHFLLPVIGCIVIGQILYFFADGDSPMGVSYVIDKVQRFRTRMPIHNAVLQFVTASLALLSGGSCGREGPAIHIGATSGCALGRGFSLPNNSIRTLIAAGSAAAISAAFNTPIAGVIFAMEVILMEYAVSGLIPVIVAAVSGAVITQALYPGEPVFIITNVSMESLWQLPWVIAMGLVIGALASGFVKLHGYATSFTRVDIRLRLLIVGLLTGSTALFMPEVLGTGYDTVNTALQENMALSFLLAMLLIKGVVSAVGVGLGLPGGLIGPSLVLGGIAGAVLGIIGEQIISGTASFTPFYVLIGMCAMMGATLQAPLAALMALLELSNNPGIVLPAMLIIVVANITSSEIFKTRSVFMNSISAKVGGFSPDLSRYLSRYGIDAVATSAFELLNADSEEALIRELLDADPQWIVIDHNGEKKSLVSRHSLQEALETPGFDLGSLETAHQVIAVSHQATLLEAMEILAENNATYGYVHLHSENRNEITGLFSQDDIMAFYKGNLS